QTNHWNGQMDIDNQKNIYLSVIAYSGTLYSGNKTKNINYATWNRVLIKYSPNFDSIEWYSSTAEINNPNSFITIRMRVGIEDQNIYLASIIQGIGSNTVNIDGKEFSRYVPDGVTKGFLIVLSNSGNFIHKDFINSDSTQ